jgi:predicted dehydrogenase
VADVYERVHRRMGLIVHGVLASFVDAIENGTEPSSPAADNLRSVALVDPALRSSASGGFVRVELGS